MERIQALERLEDQAEFYRRRIAPQLWSPFLRWMLRRQLTMSLLGVPAEQVRTMRATSGNGVDSLIESRVERVFTQVPMRVNYFWRVYMNGAYPPDCCPNYLKRENFETLRRLADRIHTHTMSLADFLRFCDRTFSIYVLLDHMDWLADSRDLLDAEWQGILRTAEDGARILYRSGGASFDRIPEFALRRIEFRSQVADALHCRDRVGTYGSFHLASVRPLAS
jgi:S-adenosylmethionine-diacylglycerol 3-amino-3-carboxypropyl transferase